jgi:hypothetical protein
MAKQPQNTDEHQESRALATASASPVPALASDELEGLHGMGYSDKSEDTMVPIMSILQDNSGEVKRGHSKKIENARAGEVIIRSMKKVIDIEAEPLVVQPCAFEHCWVRWRGEVGEGSVIDTYAFDKKPEDAVEKPDPQNPDRTIWVMPDGDRLVDTRYHYCNALIDGNWMPIVIPMGGTNHTVSRQWTGVMKAVFIQPGVRAPAWFRQYSMTTRFNQRGAQSWYTYDITALGWIEDKAIRDMGRALSRSVSEGLVTAEREVSAETLEDEDDLP